MRVHGELAERKQQTRTNDAREGNRERQREREASGKRVRGGVGQGIGKTIATASQHLMADPVRCIQHTHTHSLARLICFMILRLATTHWGEEEGEGEETGRQVKFVLSQQQKWQ